MNGSWFYKPDSPRKLWKWGAIVLCLTVLVQIFVPVHGHFTVEGVFGFAALYGFVTCLLMVVGAKLLGFLIKRPDDYYDD